MKRDLSRLLCPGSIAVIGGGWGVAVIEQLQKAGFAGEIWPVHPSREEISGLNCHRSLEDLPGAPDAAFIAVNRHLTIDTIATLSAKGAGGAVCFASGFAEAEDNRAAGVDLQAKLVAAAGDMPVLGPNCYGFINYLDGALLWPDQHGGARMDKGVAILGQSSNILINLTMQKRGLPLAYVMAAGNQAQTSLADMALSMMEDARVTALGLHIEGIGDIHAFEAMAARARELRKPIIALKVGRSAQAQAATVSHTASLAGGDAASRAFLARLNIPVVETLPRFLEALKLVHVHGSLPGRTLCSMSCSGGEAGLIADAAVGHDVTFRSLTEGEHDRVKATLSDLVTVANPLDYHTFIWDDVPRMTATYEAMLGCGFDLSCLVYDFPRTDRTDDTAWACGETAIIAASASTGARAAVISSLPENMPEDRAARLMAAGIAPLCGLDDALAAADAAATLHEGWERPAPAPVVAGSAEGAPVLVDEARAKGMLAQFGLTIPAQALANTPEEAAKAAAEIGFPIVLKRMGHAHKTEAGAVKVGLGSAEDVQREAGWMSGDGAFLVEAQIRGTVAELLVGIVRDPVYGLAMTIGAGGILTEMLEDTATLMVPSEEADIRGALKGLRVARLFEGYRGKPRAHLQAAINAIMAIQAYAITHADELHEVEVNPLMVTPDTAVAADALIRVEMETHEH